MIGFRVVLTVAALAAPSSSQWLCDARPFPTGDAPRHTAAGDMDGDGITDLVVLGGLVAPGSPATLTELHGMADGTLVCSAILPFLEDAVDLGLADLTGDGSLDVITLAPDALAVVVYASSGSGGWLAPVFTAAGGAAERLAIGDLDLDGVLDVATANGQDQTVSLCFGAGSGLAPAQVVPVGASAGSLAVAALNGDPLPDVLVLVTTAGGTQQFRLLPGLGGGALGAGQVAFTQDASDWDLSDLDTDGDLDVLTCADKTVLTGTNDGAGQFAVAYSKKVGVDLRGVDAADFDLDDAPDIVASSFGDDTLRFLRGDGLGGFKPGPMNLVPGGPSDIAVGDFGGDGRPDACAVAEPHDTVYLLAANDARLSFLPTLGFFGVSDVMDPTLGDLDGDGDLDVLMAEPEHHDLVRLLGTGTGSFGPAKLFASQEVLTTDLGDLDGDGDLDAGVTSHNWAQIYLGDGQGNLTLHLTQATVAQDLDIFLRDFDGDGNLDALTVGFHNPNLVLLRGDGAGSWLPLELISMPHPDGVGVADIDGDLDLDLVSAHDTTFQVIPWLNDGAGHFLPQPGMRTGPQPLAPVVADFDSDGRPDVAVALGGGGYLDGAVAVLLGDGAGGLAQPTYRTAPALVVSRAADLNGDGRPDFAGVSSMTGPLSTVQQLHVLVGGDQGLQQPSAMTDSAGLTGMDVGDVDGDGRLDLVMTDEVSDTLTVARNSSEPHPWHDLGHALAAAPVSPVLAPSSWAEPGSPGVLRVSEITPHAFAALLVSPASALTSFKGGVLVPGAPLTAILLAADAHGQIGMSWIGWPALPPGTTSFLQAAIADAGAPHGVALTNALKIVQP